MIIIYITTANISSSKKIAKILLKKKLSACINIIPKIHSLYIWNKKIEENEESVLIVKTIPSNFEKIKKEVLKIHPYDNPCIFSVSVKDVAKKYFQWLKCAIK